MITPQLKNFFEYKKIVDKNPQFVVDQIKHSASMYLPEDQILEIQKTYDYAKKAHEWQMRQSGEYYISHIVQATRFLMTINPDIETIQWCLLHDVIEDCNISADDIEKEFWKVVRKLCEWVTKVSSIKYRGEERQIETLKKTFFAMADDLRVVFIKLADRIHNIQTLHFHPKQEKQERIANETLEIYVPIAERLWLWQFQFLLENWCFRILHPKECDQIIHYLDKPIFHKSAEKWIGILTKLLEKEWLTNFFVKWRIKSPRSIYKKLVQKVGDFDFKRINDILAFRIICDTIPNCYMIMGIVHNAYTPLVHKIKDYIVVPKPNGYKSIHSIILWLFDFPVEIQIRTKEMDNFAEHGIAAHFAYKEAWYTAKARHVSLDPRQWEWISKLQDIVKSYQNDNEWFKHEMKIELLDKTIFVYTPKGMVIEIKEWATVLDFAFRIHSEVGLKFKNATVNGSIVPIDYQPKTGDIININTRKNQYTATWWWVNFLKTSWARNQLNKYLKTQIRTELLTKSIDNLNKRLSDAKLPLYKTTDCLIQKQYENRIEEIENKLIEMLDKWGYGSFINSFYKTELKKQKYISPKNLIEKKEWKVITIDWNSNFEYELCPECNSMDSQIIAKSWKEGIKIHHIGCKALNTIGYEKLISAHYTNDEPAIYIFKLKLDIINQSWSLWRILNIIQNYNLNIKHISFLDTKQDSSLWEITLEFSNPWKVQFILKDIASLSEQVKVVEKKFIE